VPFLEHAVIRAIPLVEALPAVYQMEEMLHALGPYGAGLTPRAGISRPASSSSSWPIPGRSGPTGFGVDIKTTPFLANIFRRLVAVCLKRGAVPIGGMATALPSSDPDVNRAAGAAIHADKIWEAQQGFIRAWVAPHLPHEDRGRPLPGAAGLRMEARARDERPRPLPRSRSRCRPAPSRLKARAATRGC